MARAPEGAPHATSPSDPEGEGGLVRLRLDLAYDGTAFAGWAVQPGLRTVQGVLEAGLARVMRLPAARTAVAGRTDAGVHARGQVVHLDVPAPALAGVVGRSGRQPCDALLHRLRGVLPDDVVVHAAARAPAGFDARFSATGRTYVYRLVDDGLARPLRRHDVVAVRGPLDVAAMAEAGRTLLGLRDFAAYCRRREGATTVRTLRRLEVARSDEVVEALAGPVLAPRPPLVLVVVEADAFCRSMVRSLVGTLVSVGQGRRPVGWPAQVMAAARRDPGVQVAPARGLVLERVDYPADDALAERATTARARRDAVLPAGAIPSVGAISSAGPAGRGRGDGGTLTTMSESDQNDATPVAQEPTDHDPVMEMADTQDDAVLDAQLDTGYSPPERERHVGRYGLVPSEQGRPETLDERLAEEEPEDGGADYSGAGAAGDDADADTDGELLDDQVGSVRAGRLVAPGGDAFHDTERDEVATDVGADGGAASAEEAAVHVVAGDAEQDEDLEPPVGRPSL